MATSETNRILDKTPLGRLLSILKSFEVLSRYLEIELGQYGATLIRFNVMSTLFSNGGEMTPSEIAGSVFREKNSVTAVLNTLERQGLIRREPSADDRRSVRVVITDEGWREANHLNPIAQELSREILSCLEKEKTADLINTMRKLRESLLPKIARAAGK